MRVAFPTGVLTAWSPWVANTLEKQTPLWPTGAKPSSVPGSRIRTVRTEALPFAQVSTATDPGLGYIPRQNKINVSAVMGPGLYTGCGERLEERASIDG